jgi:hypothetical protein
MEARLMQEIRTRVHVAADRSITGLAPSDVPPGEHEAMIIVTVAPVRQDAKKPFSVDELPSHDLGPWPEGLSLRREDMYGDEGR